MSSNPATVVLPPLVKGKLHGYLKVTVDEIIWSRSPLRLKSGFSGADFIVKTQWWGSDAEIIFRPLDVARFNSSKESSESNYSSNGNTKKFDVRTNFQLFKSYLIHCENLKFYVIEEKSGDVVGTATVYDLNKIISNTINCESNFSCYYPILNKSNHRIGDVRICFYVKDLASSRLQKQKSLVLSRKIGVKDDRQLTSNKSLGDDSDRITNETNMKLCKRHKTYFGVNYSTQQVKHKQLQDLNGNKAKLCSSDLLTKPFSPIWSGDSSEHLKCPPNTVKVSDSDEGSSRVLLDRLVDDANKLRDAMLLSVVQDSVKGGRCNHSDGLPCKTCQVVNSAENSESLFENVSTDLDLQTYDVSKMLSEAKTKTPFTLKSLEISVDNWTTNKSKLADYLTGKPMTAREERSVLETLRSISPVDNILELAAISNFTNTGVLEQNYQKPNMTTMINSDVEIGSLNSVQRPNFSSEECDTQEYTIRDKRPEKLSTVRPLDNEDGLTGVDVISLDKCDFVKEPPPVKLVPKSSSDDFSTVSSCTSSILHYSEDLKEKLLESVNSYRLTIEKLVLNECGINKVSSVALNTKETGKEKQSRNPFIQSSVNKNASASKSSAFTVPPPGCVYFVECNLNDQKKSRSAQYSTPIRFCSRKCIGNVVLFGHTSTHSITKQTKTFRSNVYSPRTNKKDVVDLGYIFSHVLNVEKWRVLWRHLNQRIPSLLAKPSISKLSVHDYNYNQSYLFEQKIVLPLQTDKNLTVGHLYIKLELGKDRMIFGSLFVGNNKLINTNTSSAEVEVQTDFDITCQKDNTNRILLHNNNDHKDVDDSTSVDNASDNLVLRKPETCNFERTNDYSYSNKNIDAVSDENVPEQTQFSCRQSNRFPQTLQQRGTAIRPYTDVITKCGINPVDATSLHDLKYVGGQKETVHEIILTIIRVTQLPLMCTDSEPLYYVEYTFPFNNNRLSEVSGDFFHTYTTSVVSGDVAPTFNYEYRHKLVLRSNSNLSLRSALYAFNNGSSDVTFTLWARFYQPRIRDHKIATALLPLTEIYNLEEKFDKRCHQRMNGLPIMLKLPLKVVESSMSKNHKEPQLGGNFGFLNIMLNYCREVGNQEMNNQYQPAVGTECALTSANYDESECCESSVEQSKKKSSLNSSDYYINQIQNLLKYKTRSYLPSEETDYGSRGDYKKRHCSFNCQGMSLPCKCRCYLPSNACEQYLTCSKGHICCNNSTEKEKIDFEKDIRSNDYTFKYVDFDSKFDSDPDHGSDNSDIVTEPIMDDIESCHSKDVNKVQTNFQDKSLLCNHCDKIIHRHVRNSKDNSKGLKDLTKGLHRSRSIIKNSSNENVKQFNVLKRVYFIDDSMDRNKSEQMMLEQNEESRSCDVDILYDHNDERYCVSESTNSIRLSNTNDNNKVKDSVINVDRNASCKDLQEIETQLDPNKKKFQSSVDCYNTTVDITELSNTVNENMTIPVQFTKDVKEKISNDKETYNKSNYHDHRVNDAVDKLASCNLERINKDTNNTFKVKIEIERALHLPEMNNTDDCKDETDEHKLMAPNTFVRIFIASNSEKDIVYEDLNLVTPVVKSNCNPYYNATFEISLPTVLLNQLNVNPLGSFPNSLSPRITVSSKSYLHKTEARSVNGAESNLIDQICNKSIISNPVLREKLTELDTVIENLKKNLIIGE